VQYCVVEDVVNRFLNYLVVVLRFLSVQVTTCDVLDWSDCGKIANFISRLCLDAMVQPNGLPENLAQHINLFP
jgi:hypothetical protein